MKYLKSYNESLRDKMTPKSEEDLMIALEPLMKEVARELTFMSNNRDIIGMEDFEEAYSFLLSKKSMVYNLVTDCNYTDPEEIAGYLASVYLRADESVRDMMKPKSEEDILNYVMGLTKEELDLFLVKSVLGQQIPLIKIALQVGADPNTLSPKNKLSVLYLAIMGSIISQPNKEIVKMLLDAGADPTLPSKRGLVPLNHAKTWNKDMYEFILQYMKTNEGVRDQMTSTSEEDIKNRISHMKEVEMYELLWHTALYEDWDTLKLYLKNGADINIKSARGETLLMDNVRTNDYVILNTLLQLGADPNIGNDGGATALTIASENGTEILVELLLLSDKLNPMKHDQLNVASKAARKTRNGDIIQMLESYKKRKLNESVKDMMTPKSPEEIEKAQRMLFDKTHMGWYEEYLTIKPLVDEACEYVRSCGFQITTEPMVFDYNTGVYGFKFDNNFLIYGLNHLKKFELSYSFTHKKYELGTYYYDFRGDLDIRSSDEIKPWNNRETDKLSLISKLKTTLEKVTKNDYHKRVLK